MRVVFNTRTQTAAVLDDNNRSSLFVTVVLASMAFNLAAWVGVGLIATPWNQGIAVETLFVAGVAIQVVALWRDKVQIFR